MNGSPDALETSLHAVQVLRANHAICEAVRSVPLLSGIVWSDSKIPRELRLYWMSDWSSPQSTPIYQVIFALPRLECLVLDLPYQDFFDVMRILRSYIPSLRRLVLPGEHWVPLLSCFPQITELELKGWAFSER